MYDLIPYLLHRIQSGGTAVVPSGRGLQRTYGEFSEVPPGISGPSNRLGYTSNGGIQPYVHEGEIRGPLRGGEVGGYKGMSGPTIEGSWSRVNPAAVAPPAEEGFGGLSALSAPVRALIRRAGTALTGTFAGPAMEAAGGPMGAVIAAGDGRPNNSLSDMKALTDAYKQARLAKAAQAQPAPQGMPPVQPLDTDSNSDGGVHPPISTDNSPPQFQPQPTQPMPPVQGFDMNGLPTHVPMPQPRPQMAQPQQVPMPHARPAAAPAPQPQQMSWFMRNALMQKDPITGQFIDPAGAARAMAQFK